MTLWRMLVETSSGLWTYVVAAPNHLRAWDTVLEAQPPGTLLSVSLEELERTGERRALIAPQIVQRWRGGRPPRAA